MGRDTLLILDPSDLVKPYTKKMEHLATVRDGSTGELKKGYWYCHVATGVSEFACYAVADGLMSIFARYPGRITPLAPISSGQGILLFDGS